MRAQGRPQLRVIAALMAAAFANARPLIAFTRPVNLGGAGNFTALAETGISAATGTYDIVGDIGVCPSAASAIKGFGLILDGSGQYSRSSLLHGKAYAGDYSAPTPSILKAAVGDMQAAYTDAGGRDPDVSELSNGSIGGLTLVPGIYRWSTGVNIASDLTLAGGASAVWIFQVAQTLDLNAGVRVLLSGGALAKNIFWQVAGDSRLGANSVFNGCLLDQTLISLAAGATLNGKALALAAMKLQSNTVISAASAYAGPNPPAAGESFAFPSPARNGLITIVYDMVANGNAEVQVWNENGELVARHDEQKLAGPQETQLPIGDLASGAYVYRVAMAYDSGSVERLDVQRFTVRK
jgi:hypothetical protein